MPFSSSQLFLHLTTARCLCHPQPHNETGFCSHTQSQGIRSGTVRERAWPETLPPLLPNNDTGSCSDTQSQGIRTVRERAWPETQPPLLLGWAHRDSNPVPPSTFQLWGMLTNWPIIATSILVNLWKQFDCFYCVAWPSTYCNNRAFRRLSEARWKFPLPDPRSFEQFKTSDADKRHHDGGERRRADIKQTLCKKCRSHTGSITLSS